MTADRVPDVVCLDGYEQELFLIFSEVERAVDILQKPCRNFYARTDSDCKDNLIFAYRQGVFEVAYRGATGQEGLLCPTA